jgi:short-subunit dehydrogenase
VISLTETLHAELHAYSVNASVVCPTFFRSGIMQHRKGDAETGSIAKGIVERAKHSSDDIANHILVEAGKNKFYILFSYQSKFVFHFKRFFPMLFLNYKAKQFSKDNGIKWLEKTLEM